MPRISPRALSNSFPTLRIVLVLPRGQFQILFVNDRGELFSAASRTLSRSCSCLVKCPCLFVGLNQVTFCDGDLHSEFLSVGTVETAAIALSFFLSCRIRNLQQINFQRLTSERGRHSYAQNLSAPICSKSISANILCTAAILSFR